MANYLTTDTALTAVANAIRTKGGTSAQLEFPDGFVTAIGNIPGGGSGVGELTKYYREIVTPVSSAEITVTHNLGVLPKYVSVEINSQPGDNTVAFFACDQNTGGAKTGAGASVAYTIVTGETGETNSYAYLTTTGVIARRNSSARTFSTSESYTVTIYA